MKTQTQKALEITALPASIALIVAGFMGATAANATPAPTPSPAAVTQSGAPSATTKTIPWCGWTIQNLPSNITLRDSSVTGNATSKYKGVAISLTGTATGIKAFVGGTGSYDSDPDNCSWYNDANKQGLQLAVTSPANPKFTASAEKGGADTDMGFDLTSTAPLSITPDYGNDCATGFQTNASLSIYTDHVSAIPVRTQSKDTIDTTTVCTWSLAYATKIPGGKSPKFGDELYTFTGPTLTTTVSID